MLFSSDAEKKSLNQNDLKTMADKIIPSVNKWLKCLDTQLKEPTNQNTIKVLKVIQPTNKKP